jgi:hypothetical protein
MCVHVRIKSKFGVKFSYETLFRNEQLVLIDKVLLLFIHEQNQKGIKTSVKSLYDAS